MEFTRIKNDVNGNPRYVVHFLQCEPVAWRDNEFSTRYDRVVKLMNKIGGKRFHNRQYGGGIVFQSYSTDETRRAIEQLVSTVK